MIARIQAGALISAAPVLVRGGEGAQHALLALVKALQTAVPSLWRASLRKLIPDEEQLEIVAVWSAVETRLNIGVRMSVMATSFPEVLRSGEPVVGTQGPGYPSPVAELLAAEGARSWIAIPIRR